MFFNGFTFLGSSLFQMKTCDIEKLLFYFFIDKNEEEGAFSYKIIKEIEMKHNYRQTNHQKV